MCSYNLNRLIGTAMVDKAFQARLLADPGAAAQGFDLTPDEYRLVASIRASNLTEFAQKLDGALSFELVPVGGPGLAPVQSRGPSDWAADPPLALHLHTGF
ncbi:MAG: Franean1_4349 family RiPP [Anaerolineae bacterium]|nr:Franean1_4349 family RiPP [Anaerolineae bacterium]